MHKAEIKTFGDKEIIIRRINNKDVAGAKKFQNYINALVSEDAKILVNRKFSIKEETEAVKGFLAEEKKKNQVRLVAEHNNQIVSGTDIKLERYRKNHVGIFGISVRDGYRGLGLGKYMMGSIIALAKKELSPRLKIISLTVYSNNDPAIRLYKKMGFKKVAVLPKYIQYKGRLVDEFVMIKEV